MALKFSSHHHHHQALIPIHSSELQYCLSTLKPPTPTPPSRPVRWRHLILQSTSSHSELLSCIGLRLTVHLHSFDSSHTSSPSTYLLSHHFLLTTYYLSHPTSLSLHPPPTSLWVISTFYKIINMKFIHPISFFSNLHTYFYLTQSLIQELNHFDDQTSIMFLRWIQGMGSNLHHRWMWTNSFISQSALISTLLWYLYFKYDLWRSSDLQNSISLDPISYTHPESIGKTIKSKNQKSTLQSRALIWCSKHLELSSSQVSTVNPLRVLHHQNLSQVSSTWTNHLNIFIKKKEKRKKKIYVCSCTLEFFLLIAFVFQQFLGKLIKISETGWWDLNQPLKDKDIKKFRV